MSQQRGGRQLQAKNFAEKQINTLLDLVSTLLPISKIEWEQLTTDYNKIYELEPRNSKSLK